MVILGNSDVRLYARETEPKSYKRTFLLRVIYYFETIYPKKQLAKRVAA